MSGLLINSQTAKEINAYIKNPSPVIICGPSGTGKHSIAKLITKKVINLPNDTYKSLLEISTPDASISINEIRLVNNFLKLKTTGTNEFRRAIIIDNAQKMTEEAQNALLKILEEPPRDTLIILTVTNELGLLPTIRSRSQVISIKPLDLNKINKHFSSKGYKKDDIQKAFYMCDGRIALISAMLEGKHEDRIILLKKTKRVLTSKLYDRLIESKELISDKENLPQYLETIDIVCHSALKQASIKNNIAHINYWLKLLKDNHRSREILRHNPNAKLLVLNLLFSY